MNLQDMTSDEREKLLRKCASALKACQQVDGDVCKKDCPYYNNYDDTQGTCRMNLLNDVQAILDYQVFRLDCVREMHLFTLRDDHIISREMLNRRWEYAPDIVEDVFAKMSDELASELTKKLPVPFPTRHDIHMRVSMELTEERRIHG